MLVCIHVYVPSACVRRIVDSFIPSFTRALTTHTPTKSTRMVKNRLKTFQNLGETSKIR